MFLLKASLHFSFRRQESSATNTPHRGRQNDVAHGVSHRVRKKRGLKSSILFSQCVVGNERESGGQQRKNSPHALRMYGGVVNVALQTYSRWLITEVCVLVCVCGRACVSACAIWVTAQQRVWTDLVKAQTLMQLHSGRFMMWNTKGKETMITFMRCHFLPLLSEEFVEFFASLFPILCPPFPKWAFVSRLCLKKLDLILSN